ncbi:MAG: thioredoxin domain-containing protein [Candidatus Nitrosocaldus sp.]|nr:thioredoxin domain-containing protein [Candidatus Nitrosocaldus sp.]MDW7999530.1 thioredoxin domain-containing protein [Candidatus Nitrosocaldus sp.]
MGRRLNRLASETSPYLLQHADNPVDWYPWSEEALRRAREEDKPIFLSIGYSACHWCHVMEHECFEDEEVARIMNEHYINIKVDREERPDIDDVYQRVCQLVTGTGGWPLSVFLTPDLKPFYVGTYFPKEDRYGLPGFPRLLTYLAELYRNDRERVKRQVEMIMNGLSMLEVRPRATESLDGTLLDEAAVHLLDDADMVNGGFGGAPKFPNAMNLMFLLRYHRMKGMSRFLNFVLFTLNRMADGGIHDQIGGGFHRYSVDARWMVPHFEKMLYDNALLALLYAEAYQVSRDERYMGVMKGILDYVLREMVSSENGFCSSQDADSEGEEGRYYTWSKDEVRRLIGSDEYTDILCAYYGISEQGNFEGRNVLHVSMSIDALASRFNKSVDEVKSILERCRALLFNAREARVKPGRDEKVILAWNGLMISAMVKGYRVSDDSRYLDAALNAVDMVEARMVDGSRLKRIYKDGIAKVDAYLDDYASYMNALLDLFEVRPRRTYLDKAAAYADHMLQHFWDDDSNDLYYTSDEHEQLIVRSRSPYDLSTPSGNSMAVLALIRLYHYTHKQGYISAAESIMKAHAVHAAENPYAYGNMLNALYLYLRRPVEVTMITSTTDDLMSAKHLWREFMPECMAVIASREELDGLEGVPFFSGRVPSDGGFTAYVCKGFRCSLPLHSIEEVRRHILEEAQV